MVSLLRSCADAILDCLPCYPSKEKASQKTVSIIVGFFFMVNYQMATGFLGIPFSFFQGGLLAGALTLLVIAFVSWVAAIWVLEVMARAQVRMHACLCYAIMHWYYYSLPVERVTVISVTCVYCIFAKFTSSCYCM